MLLNPLYWCTVTVYLPIPGWFNVLKNHTKSQETSWPSNSADAAAKHDAPWGDTWWLLDHRGFLFREIPLETKRSILWFLWVVSYRCHHGTMARRSTKIPLGIAVAFPLESPWWGNSRRRHNPMTYDFYTQCTCGQDGSNILASVAELYKMQIDPMFLNILCSSFAEGCKNKAPTKKKNPVLPSGGQTWQPWWLLPNDGSWLMDLRTIQAPKQPCRPGTSKQKQRLLRWHSETLPAEGWRSYLEWLCIDPWNGSIAVWKETWTKLTRCLQSDLRIRLSVHAMRPDLSPQNWRVLGRFKILTHPA